MVFAVARELSTILELFGDVDSDIDSELDAMCR